MTTFTTNVSGTATRPMREWLKILSIVGALIGLAITIYLSYTKLFGLQQICAANETFNCELVQNTVYSRIFGIPIQYLGLVGWVAILAALLLETRIAILGRYGKQILAGFTLFGFLYSAYLTSIEAFVIHAWCMWCLANATTMTFVFAVSALRLWRYLSRPIMLEDLDDSDDEEFKAA
jgi:uncharacterized membrane protein